MFCQLTFKATGAVRAASSRAQAGTWSRERPDRRLAARVRTGDDAKILTPRRRKEKKTDLMALIGLQPGGGEENVARARLAG